MFTASPRQQAELRLTARLFVSCGLLLAAVYLASTSVARAQEGGATQLVTGKRITPLGTQQNVGSLPMNMILSPNGKYALVSDMGVRQYLTSLKTATGKLAQPSGAQIAFGAPYAGKNGLYYGLAIAANHDGSSTLYAAQGANASIAVLKLAVNGTLAQTGVIAMRPGDFPAGLALDGKGRLYVAVNAFYLNGYDTRELTTPGQMVIYDTLAAGVIVPQPASPAPEAARIAFNSPPDTFGSIALSSGAVPFTPTNYPFAIAALTNGSKVYVSSQRDNVVFAIDRKPPAAPVVTPLATGAHPVALLLNRAQTLLYVANAQSDTLAAVNTRTNAIVSLSLRPPGATDLPGATPTALALSPGGTTLYAALGDMNAVAVIDTATFTLRGYLPVGWYPSALAVISRNGANSPDVLLAANAKGVQAVNPNPLHITHDPPSLPYEDAHNGENLLEGTVSRIDTSAINLTAMTQQVLANNHIIAHTSSPANPLAAISLKAGKITHILYIVKENRTYDQVLGDLTDDHGATLGNGDPALVLFGKNVTPNQHALAKRFVLLDNFYDCGEASGDGWPWSTQAQANEYVIKNLPYNYSGRGRNYDFDGQNNGYPVGGFPAKDGDGKLLSKAFPNGGPALPDVTEAPGSHLWDNLARHGLSYRNYGFFYSSSSRSLTPDNVPGATGLRPAGHYAGGPPTPASGSSDVDYRRFDENYADSDGPANDGSPYRKATYGLYGSGSRFAEWNREFQLMLKAGGNTARYVPNLMLLRVMNDHTQGYKKGRPTPRAQVADNDYAVGQIVQAVSQSALWSHCAIFIVEDDAQDGPDHVDCHRSPCYVISPYIKAASVDSAFYNTNSVIETIELLLGLPPMNQYDATAPPIAAPFGTTPDNRAPYLATTADKSILCDIVPLALAPQSLMEKLVKMCADMDFSQPDNIPVRRLNEALWKGAKGLRAAPPALRHNRHRTGVY